MINQTLSDELVLFFERYLSFYKEFLQLETEKYQDISNDRYQRMDRHVKSEEAFMLRSRGLELERDKLMSKVGVPDVTFRELIPLFDSPWQDKVKNIFNELSTVLLDLKDMNNRCNSSITIRLRQIQTAIDKLDKHPDHQKIYTSHAGNNGQLTGILYKKI